MDSICVLNFSPNTWKFIWPISGFLAGILVSLIVPLIVEYFKGRIWAPELIFVPQKEKADHVSHVKFLDSAGNKVEAKYLRVGVKNIGRISAKDCCAYLISVQNANASSASEKKYFIDTLRLRWAFEYSNELYSGITIHKNSKFYFDICSTRIIAGHGEETQLECSSDLARARYRQHCEFENDYEFYVMVAAAEVNLVYFRIKAKIGKSWKDLECVDAATVAMNVE